MRNKEYKFLEFNLKNRLYSEVSQIVNDVAGMGWEILHVEFCEIANRVATVNKVKLVLVKEAQQ